MALQFIIISSLLLLRYIWIEGQQFRLESTGKLSWLLECARVVWSLVVVEYALLVQSGSGWDFVLVIAMLLKVLDDFQEHVDGQHDSCIVVSSPAGLFVCAPTCLSVFGCCPVINQL